MNIGLFDQDLALGYKPYPNLELMKIASYYKEHRDLTRLMESAKEYEQFSRIYIRKEIVDKNFPNRLISNINTEFGGYAFTNGIYVPMEDKFERCLPDTSLYDKFIKNHKIRHDYKTILKSSLIRLETTRDFKKFITNSNRFVFYDKDLNKIEDSFKCIDYCGQTGVIQVLNPMYFDDLEEALIWAKQSYLLTSNKIIYTENISLKEIKEFSKRTKENKLSIRMKVLKELSYDASVEFFAYKLKEVLETFFYVKESGSKIDFYSAKLFKNVDFNDVCFALNNVSQNFSLKQAYYNINKNVDFIEQLEKRYELKPLLNKKIIKGGI